MAAPVFIDFEYDSSPDRLISLGLYQDNILEKKKAYVVFRDHLTDIQDPWVNNFVMPHLDKPLHSEVKRYDIFIKDIGVAFNDFFKGNNWPMIVADHGLDIAMFAKLTIDASHNTHPVFENISYQHRRIDAFPTAIPGLTQHHALDDAIALGEAHEFISMNKEVLFKYNEENNALWINPGAHRGDPIKNNVLFCGMMAFLSKTDTIAVANHTHTFDFYNVQGRSHAERLDLIQEIFFKYSKQPMS